MVQDHDRMATYPEAKAIQIARWVVVGLPQELAMALEAYAAHLGHEATLQDAVRHILQDVLFDQRRDGFISA